MKTTTKLFSFLALAALLLAANAPAFGAANIVIVNLDGANEGFNDPTPAAPLGGNPGTTIGQQRLIAFQYAASIWGSILDSPVPIYVQAVFDPLACTANAATLGSAGAIQIFRDFPGREYDGIWYHVALANKLAGEDLAPGPNGTVNDDLVARFNANLGNVGCLTGIGFYYGLDANHGTQVDLVTVLLHEFGHGLGFANFVTEATGAQPDGRSDIFATYTLDTTTGKHWPQMTAAEIAASSVNTNKVVWDGINVVAKAPSVLQLGSPLVTINSPAGLGPYRFGAANFGPAVTAPGVTGNVVRALDVAEPPAPPAVAGTTFDGCSPFTNAAAVAGKIAMVDRGLCGFAIKVKNAQDAGAIGVLVADNAPGSPAGGMTGVDPTITIPSVRLSLPDSNAVKAALASGPVNATIGLNTAVRAGADPQGRVLLNAPNPVVAGSSISHWDPIAFPNLLMEPAINGDLTHGVDLTRQEMTDIGWFSDGDGVPDGRDQCIGSSRSATVVIGGCNSGVTNTTFASGCRITDQINDCAVGASNHGGFVSCVSHLTNDLKKAGVISGSQKGAIQSCAGGASIP
jgi:hypothetical protein